MNLIRRLTTRQRLVATMLLVLAGGAAVVVLIHEAAPEPGTNGYQRYVTLTPNLWLLSGKKRCVATRIGPQTLITARHCVDLETNYVARQAASGASASFSCAGPTLLEGPPDIAVCSTTQRLPDVAAYEVIDRQTAIEVGHSLDSVGFKSCGGPVTHETVGMASHEVTALPTKPSDILTAKNNIIALCLGDSGAPVLQPVGSDSWRIVAIVRGASLGNDLVATALGAADWTQVPHDATVMCIDSSASAPGMPDCRPR